MSNAMILPPKMLAQYEQKARKGESDVNTGNIHIFYVPPRQEICIILCGDTSAVGHSKKLSTQEWEHRKLTP